MIVRCAGSHGLLAGEQARNQLGSNRVEFMSFGKNSKVDGCSTVDQRMSKQSHLPGYTLQLPFDGRSNNLQLLYNMRYLTVRPEASEVPQLNNLPDRVIGNNSVQLTLTSLMSSGSADIIPMV